VATDDGEPLRVGLVAHHVFCPRRAWLEAAGERSDTAQMAIGERDSEPSDDPSRSRGARVRALDVASEQLGLVGRCDTVEHQEDGTLVVVEHKATPVRRSTTVTEATRVQLALLGRCLEEMGYCVSGYAVWFSTHRTRVDVVVGEPERAAAKAAVEATRSTVRSAQAPSPLEDDPRCRSCSHVGVCLPDERDLGPVRRRLAPDPDGQVLHLSTPGSRAGLRTGRVRVVREGEELASVPLERDRRPRHPRKRRRLLSACAGVADAVGAPAMGVWARPARRVGLLGEEP